MDQPTLHFACTRCGACCNRSPELALSEAAGLADVFVLRLMFRLYRVPRTLKDQARTPGARLPPAAFFERRRLLDGFAVRSTPRRVKVDGAAVEQIHDLVLSALPLDLPRGACAALRGGDCGIYARRPLSCHSVPLHYSVPDSLAAAELAEFVARPGHRCATGPEAPALIAGGRIMDDAVAAARAAALECYRADRGWAQAILARMKPGDPLGESLPSLRQIEASAGQGALTTSMRVGWQIAAEAGLIEAEQLRGLITRQLALIERELLLGRAGGDEMQTLTEMQAEYRAALAAPRGYPG